MKIEDLISNVKELTTDELKRKINSLVRENPSYKNLDQNNRKVILVIIKKIIERIKKGRKIDSRFIRDEMIKLKKNRIKLDLSEKDLDDIEDILKKFRE